MEASRAFAEPRPAGSKEQGRFFSRLFGDGYDAFCMQVQGEVGKELSAL